MELFLLLFFAAVAVAGATGLVADSRDFADWRPTNGGFREPPCSERIEGSATGRV
jgi:hypothetical protein